MVAYIMKLNMSLAFSNSSMYIKKSREARMYP